MQQQRCHAGWVRIERVFLPLPFPLAYPSSLNARFASLFDLPVAGRSNGVRESCVRERVGGFWRASVRPTVELISTGYVVSVGIKEGTFPKGSRDRVTYPID